MLTENSLVSKRLPTVAAYFENRLGMPLVVMVGATEPTPDSPAHPAFHIGTGCGVACKRAIDVAAELLELLEPDGIATPQDRARIVMMTAALVRTYVWG